MRKEVVAGEPRAAAMPQIVRAEVDEEVALATAESEDDDVPLLERFKVRRVTCLVICLVTLAAGLASHPHSRT
jgi:hypothetical protein